MADRRPPADDHPHDRRRRRQEEPNVPPGASGNDNDAPRPPPPVPLTAGADLTYPELLRLPPQDPVPEVFAPHLIPALMNPPPTRAVLWDHLGHVLPVHEPDYDGPPPITLIHDDATAGQQQPTHAYAFLPDRKPIRLTHAMNWGQVHFAVIYPHHVGDPPHVYRAPDPAAGPPPRVAIKMLNKAVVDQELARGGRENPYKEICRYQELGDNVHVIRCEALQDAQHLFIVTPMCRSFVEEIFGRSSPMPPATIHAYFVQMLRILLYLEQHDIHHRDLSPDNLFLLPRPGGGGTNDMGQLVLVDFAMSLRIPKAQQPADPTRPPHRTLIKDQGNFGTPSWMAPEIMHRFPFDGVASDLWCVMHIFYNMLTVNLLYRRPMPADWSYRFFVLAGGLTNEGMNEQAIEVLQDIAEQAQAGVHEEILNRAMAHLAFAPSVRTLLRHTFQNAPHERWTLGQVIRSDYVVNGPE